MTQARSRFGRSCSQLSKYEDAPDSSEDGFTVLERNVQSPTAWDRRQGGQGPGLLKQLSKQSPGRHTLPSLSDAMLRQVARWKQLAGTVLPCLHSHCPLGVIWCHLSCPPRFAWACQLCALLSSHRVASAGSNDTVTCTMQVLADESFGSHTPPRSPRAPLNSNEKPQLGSPRGSPRGAIVAHKKMLASIDGSFSAGKDSAMDYHSPRAQQGNPQATSSWPSPRNGRESQV